MMLKDKWVLLGMGIALARPLWLIPLSYLLLTTFRFDPNGILVWSLLVALVVSIVVLIARFFVGVGRFSKVLQKFRRNANEEGRRAYIADMGNRPSVGLMIFAVALIQFLIPCGIALSVWSDIKAQRPVVSRKHPTQSVTPEKALNHLLSDIRKQGFWSFSK